MIGKDVEGSSDCLNYGTVPKYTERDAGKHTKQRRNYHSTHPLRLHLGRGLPPLFKTLGSEFRLEETEKKNHIFREYSVLESGN
jgi:hypothetical protein